MRVALQLFDVRTGLTIKELGPIAAGLGAELYWRLDSVLDWAHDAEPYLPNEVFALRVVFLGDPQR